jgi:hypothetical protein
MKEHFCPAEHSIITYQDQCNWCGEKEKEWVGLTDEEAQWLYDNSRTPSNLIDMVEAKLKEKNT